MIVDPSRRTVVSSLGWVDKDALWVLGPDADGARTLSLGSGARYVALHSAGTPLFTVAHHYDGSRFMVTARSFADPAASLAGVVIDAAGIGTSGDATVWAGVPSLYTAFLACGPWRGTMLVRIPAGAPPSVGAFGWYDDSFDYGYQNPIDGLALPDGETALVAVSRSSDLIVHDLATAQRRRSVRLAGQMGNPVPHQHPDTGEIWAIDYDTIVALDPSTWRVRRTARLQPAAGNTSQFVGDLSFCADGSVLVPRPFSRDVVALDAETLHVVRAVPLPGQPLEAALLAGGEVVARDWQSGRLLRARFPS